MQREQIHRRLAAAAVLIIAIILPLCGAGGVKDFIAMGVWFASILAAVLYYRGKGKRVVVAATFVSLLFISGYTVFIYADPVNQNIRDVLKRDLLRKMPFVLTAWTLYGAFVGGLVRCAIEGRRRWFAALFFGWIGSICGAFWLVSALDLAAKVPGQGPPPLGVGFDEFQQYEPVSLSDDTEETESDLDVDYERVKDLAYGPHGWRNTLDLYVPKVSAERRPVIIYIHGGSWASGDKVVNFNWQKPSLLPLLNRGYVVASINYRLTLRDADLPEVLRSAELPNSSEEVTASFPAQIQDCKRAIRFLRANAARFALDSQRIGVIGHSAGGHLAALVGVANDVPEFEAEPAYPDTSSRVQGVVVIAGPTDLRVFNEQNHHHLACLNHPRADQNVIRQNDPREDLNRLLGGLVRKNLDKAAKASPVSYVSEDDPPILLIYGFRDNSVPPHQGEYFHSLLQQAGVQSDLVLLPGTGHFINSLKIGRRIADFFDQHLAVPD